MRRLIPCLALLLLAVGGCKALGLAPNEPDLEAVRRPARGEKKAPLHVVVKHVLIGVEGAGVPGVTRTLEEAQVLAVDVFEKARAGEDFELLIDRYSDDRNGDGMIAMSNFGRSPRKQGEVSRTQMVRGFGDVAFGLEVDEVGLVEYAPPRDSPYGFHVMKRIK